MSDEQHNVNVILNSHVGTHVNHTHASHVLVIP